MSHHLIHVQCIRAPIHILYMYSGKFSMICKNKIHRNNFRRFRIFHGLFNNIFGRKIFMVVSRSWKSAIFFAISKMYLKHLTIVLRDVLMCIYTCRLSITALR